jgi:aminodeoxyfutalosine synthase
MQPFFQDSELLPLYEKVRTQERLAGEDGITLYRSRDLLGVGYLANQVRERRHGRRAYYIYNQHLNYSNVCVNGCQFCAFGKTADDPEAYTMTLDEILAKVQERLDEPISEIHIVGGLHPDLPFSYYLDMLRGIRDLRPEVHLQAFTAVEIAYLADLAGLSVADTLEALKDAGLGSLPGGGAEVFSPRIRSSLCPKKLSPEGWLEVAKTAHRLGLKTNATMLYGHLETVEERVEHLVRLREAQDETGGFVTFIPLAFHPDNFPHIKAFWIMIGPKLAQLSLAFGADDIDGTVIEEKITHMAGAKTPMSLTRTQLLHLIQEAGCEPVERDTLYNVISS